MSDMERRSADKRITERDAARTNPEVMGRSEPRSVGEQRTMEAQQTVEPRTDATRRPDLMAHPETRPEMSDLHMQLQQLQSEFMEDPKGAVEKAERLIDDLFNNLREKAQTIHRDIEKNGDTEHLRLAMRSYREMIESLGTRRAA